MKKFLSEAMCEITKQGIKTRLEAPEHSMHHFADTKSSVHIAVKCMMFFVPGVDNSPFVSCESLDGVSEVAIELVFSGRLLRSKVKRLSLLPYLAQHKSIKENKYYNKLLLNNKNTSLNCQLRSEQETLSSEFLMIELHYFVN